MNPFRHPAQHVIFVGRGESFGVGGRCKLPEIVIVHQRDSTVGIGHLYLPALVVGILCGNVVVGVGDGGDKTAVPAPVDVYPDQRHSMEHPPGR